MFSSNPAAGVATANPCTGQHGSQPGWLGPAPLLTYTLAPSPVQSAVATPRQSLTPPGPLQPTLLAAQAAPTPPGYLQLQATVLTLGASVATSVPMVAAPVGAASLTSQLAASVQPPVMHPNLVTTLKSIIDEPTKSSSPPPGLTDLPAQPSSEDNSGSDRTSMANHSAASSSPQDHIENTSTSLNQDVHPISQCGVSSVRSRGVKRSSKENSSEEQERKRMRSLPAASEMSFMAANCSTVGGAGSTAMIPMRSLERSQPTARKGGRSAQIRSAEAANATVVPVDLIHNRRPFRCQWAGCNKTFKNWQTLKMHLKTHDGADAAMSPPWGDAMSPWHGAGRAGQNKKIPSRCPECGNTFVGLYELRRHYGRKHLQGEKPFACKKCNKRFFVEVDLRDHEKVCGESLQCRCGMRFAFKCNLVNHMRLRPECQAGSARESSPTSGFLLDATALPFEEPSLEVKSEAVSRLRSSGSGHMLSNDDGTVSHAASTQATAAPISSGGLLGQAGVQGGAPSGLVTTGLLAASPELSLGVSPGTSHGSSRAWQQNHTDNHRSSSSPGVASPAVNAIGTAEAATALALAPLWSSSGGLEGAEEGSAPKQVQDLWTQAAGISEPQMSLNPQQFSCSSTLTAAAAASARVSLHSSYTVDLPSDSTTALQAETPIQGLSLPDLHSPLGPTMR